MIREAFESLENLCYEQGTPLPDALQDDGATRLTVALTIRHAERFLSGVEAFPAEVGASLSCTSSSGVVQLTRTPQGQWRIDDGDIKSVAPSIPGADVRDAWSSDELAGADVDGVWEARLTVHKEPWRAAVKAATGCSSWIGYSEASFETWLRDRGWRQVAYELFSSPKASVVLHTWRGLPITLGTRLRVGGWELGEDPTAEVADVAWPQEIDKAFLCAAHIEPVDGPPHRNWMQELLRVAGASAAEVLMLANGSLAARGSGALSIQWNVDHADPAEIRDVEAVLALCRWTSEEPTLTRLAVAWRVASERIENPFRGPRAEPLVHAAEIAYQTAIDQGVREALSKQVALEESFREMDTALAASRSALTDSVDSAVTRAMAGALAIGIASVTAENFEGWLVTGAAWLLASYLLYQGTVGLAMHRRDVELRLDGLEELVVHRGTRMAASMPTRIRAWKGDLNNRVRCLRIWLVVASVIVGAVGVAGGLATSHSGSGSRRKDVNSVSPSPAPSRLPGRPSRKT